MFVQKATSSEKTQFKTVQETTSGSTNEMAM